MFENLTKQNNNYDYWKIGTIILLIFISFAVFFFLFKNYSNYDLMPILQIGGSSVIAFVILVFFVCAYFTPSLVAVLIKNRNIGSILVLNLFLGWTFLGWVGALIWAVYQSRDVFCQNCKARI